MRRGRKGAIEWRNLFEACYAPASDDADWAANLLAVAMPILNHGSGLGLSVFDEQKAGCTVRLAVGCGEMTEAFHRLTVSVTTLEDETYRAMFYPTNLVVRASTAFRSSTGSRAFLAEARTAASVVDAVGLLVYPRARSVGLLTAYMPHDAPIARTTRARMHHLREHLESGLRLRVRQRDAPAAVLTPDGKIVHASDDATAIEAWQALRAQTQRMEARGEPDQQLDAWQALVHGRWSLVPRTDSDGKRHYIAYENVPDVQRRQALTAFERAVVQRLLQGVTAKSVAYDLQRSPVAVSRTLSSAMRKLGFRSEVELFRVGSQLYQQARPRTTPLTDGERSVLSLLLQGHSNAEIARLRGSSVHTVANQVATVLRKCGSSSRRTLWVQAVVADGPSDSTTSRRLPRVASVAAPGSTTYNMRL